MQTRQFRFRPPAETRSQPNRDRRRARSSSHAIAVVGSRSCSSRRRWISARCASDNAGKFSGSAATLSHSSSASWIRSAGVSLRSSVTRVSSMRSPAGFRTTGVCQSAKEPASLRSAGARLIGGQGSQDGSRSARSQNLRHRRDPEDRSCGFSVRAGYSRSARVGMKSRLIISAPGPDLRSIFQPACW
jgi:hypothetical protein